MFGQSGTASSKSAVSTTTFQATREYSGLWGAAANQRLVVFMPNKRTYMGKYPRAGFSPCFDLFFFYNRWTAVANTDLLGHFSDGLVENMTGWTTSASNLTSSLQCTAVHSKCTNVHFGLLGPNYTIKKTCLSCDASHFYESYASPGHNGKNIFYP